MISDKRIDKENSKFISYFWYESPKGESCLSQNHLIKDFIVDKYINNTGNKAITYTCSICDYKLHKELIEKDIIGGNQ